MELYSRPRIRRVTPVHNPMCGVSWLIIWKTISFLALRRPDPFDVVRCSHDLSRQTHSHVPWLDSDWAKMTACRMIRPFAVDNIIDVIALLSEAGRTVRSVRCTPCRIHRGFCICPVFLIPVRPWSVACSWIFSWVVWRHSWYCI